MPFHLKPASGELKTSPRTHDNTRW